MVGLLACSKQKLEHRAPARELYCSQLFKKSLRYLDCHTMEVAVISAKYGIVLADDERDPYDQTLNEMTRAERDEWALGVRRELLEHWDPKQRFLFLGGREYLRPLRGLHVHDPLAGMQIGERLHWLTERLVGDEPRAEHGISIWVADWTGGKSLGNVRGPTLEIATKLFWDPKYWPMCTFTTRTMPRKEDITFRHVTTWFEPIAVQRKRWLAERGLAPQET
jgi:hypothetical protein